MGERGGALSLDADIRSQKAQEEERLIVKGRMMMNWALHEVTVQPSSQAELCPIPHCYAHAVIAHLGIM